MANRYWVGGTGNWDASTTTHWSATSGGAGGASAPTGADNVYFDNLSFTTTGQIVTITAAVNCLDMDWTGATNNPTLAGSFGLTISGSIKLISSMIFSKTDELKFIAGTTGKTIDTAGLSMTSYVNFFGSGGGWTLQSDLVVTHTVGIFVQRGTLNSNNKNINTTILNITNTTARSLVLGSSIVTISDTLTATDITNLTFDAGTSTIKLTGNNKTFTGGGLTYNNVELQGTPTTITGSNTFNTLTIAAGKTAKLTSGTTQTVTSLVCNGTTASPSTLQSVTAGSTATIALPTGRYFIRHTSIKDITITGATAVTSIAGTNVSGNTGITFVAKFEMGRIKNDGSFNWYNSTTGTVTKVSG